MSPTIPYSNSKCRRSRSITWPALAAVGLIVCATPGCGDGRPTTYPVSGSVRFTSGSPVRTGFVELLPSAGGPSARGRLDLQGNFTLETYEKADGAEAGDYVAIIVQHSRPVSAEEGRRLGPAHEQHAGAHQLVSLKYSSRKTSDLKCTVSISSENRLAFTVEPQPVNRNEVAK